MARIPLLFLNNRLSKIGIGNFKTFSDFQTARLAPITLIFGPNSGGKSSIIQALLLLCQTMKMQSNEEEYFDWNDWDFLRPKQLRTKGDFVDSGSFHSLIHKHELERTLSLQLDFGKRNSVSLRLDFQNTEILNSSIKTELPILSSINFKYNELEIRLLSKSFIKEDNGIKEELSYFVFSDENSIRSFINMYKKEIDELIENLTDEDGASDKEIIHFFQNMSILDEGSFVSEKLNNGNFELLEFPQFFKPFKDLFDFFYLSTRNLTYLGPFRGVPERFYRLNQSANASIGGMDDKTAQLIYSRSSLRSCINDWLKKFEIPYLLDTEKISNVVMGELIFINLKDKRSQTMVSPKDVGFGISQLLPIITEGLIGNNKLICVEQPELHLHPRLQGHIADFLINTSGIEKSSKEKGFLASSRKQWIIETHSEALIVRLLRRIREGIISPEDVCVLYVDPPPIDDDPQLEADHFSGGTRIIELHIDQDGDFIDEWPHGFFEETYNDSFAQQIDEE